MTKQVAHQSKPPKHGLCGPCSSQPGHPTPCHTLGAPVHSADSTRATQVSSASNTRAAPVCFAGSTRATLVHSEESTRATPAHSGGALGQHRYTLRVAPGQHRCTLQTALGQRRCAPRAAAVALYRERSSVLGVRCRHREDEPYNGDFEAAQKPARQPLKNSTFNPEPTVHFVVPAPPKPQQ